MHMLAILQSVVMMGSVFICLSGNIKHGSWQTENIIEAIIDQTQESGV